jgi:hypothetical protein
MSPPRVSTQTPRVQPNLPTTKPEPVPTTPQRDRTDRPPPRRFRRTRPRVDSGAPPFSRSITARPRSPRSSGDTTRVGSLPVTGAGVDGTAAVAPPSIETLQVFLTHLSGRLDANVGRRETLEGLYGDYLAASRSAEGMATVARMGQISREASQISRRYGGETAGIGSRLERVEGLFEAMGLAADHPMRGELNSLRERLNAQVHWLEAYRSRPLP